MNIENNPFFVGATKWGKAASANSNTSFSAKQAQFAKDTIQEGLTSGHKLLDVVRAIVSASLSRTMHKHGFADGVSRSY